MYMVIIPDLASAQGQALTNSQRRGHTRADLEGQSRDFAVADVIEYRVFQQRPGPLSESIIAHMECVASMGSTVVFGLSGLKLRVNTGTLATLHGYTKFIPSVRLPGDPTTNPSFRPRTHRLWLELRVSFNLHPASPCRDHLLVLGVLYVDFAFTPSSALADNGGEQGEQASQGHEWLNIEFSHPQLSPPFARDPGLMVAEKLTHHCRRKSVRPGSNWDFSPQRHTRHLKGI